TLRLGALVPLTGAGAWFGAEIKQGLELAAAELKPLPPRAPSLAGGMPDAPAPPDEREHKSAREAKPGVSEAKPAAPETPPAAVKSGPAGAALPPSGGEARSGVHGTEDEAQLTGKTRGSRPQVEPVEPEDRPRTLALAVQAVDVQPADVREAEAEATRLLGTGVSAILTASPTPTLTALPLAVGRNVLVLHAGLATERFPGGSRTLIHLRPSTAFRADVLAAYAWERGIRRLAVIAGGDPFGRAVRTTVASRWRQQGGQLVHDESI